MKQDNSAFERVADTWVRPAILTDREDIANFLGEVERSCRSSVDILAQGSMPLANAEEPLQRVLERGIRVRCIYERDLVESESGRAYLARWRSLGEQQLVLDAVPVRAAVIDGAIVCVPIIYDGPSIRSLLVAKAGLGKAIAYLFDLLWEAPPKGPRHVGRSLTTEEVRILTMMCDGSSDEQIGRALGISPRTVQRRLHQLAQLMDAPSRAALAARAVAYGLVIPFAESTTRAAAPGMLS